MGNFAENLNLGNRVRPPLFIRPREDSPSRSNDKSTKSGPATVQSSLNLAVLDLKKGHYVMGCFCQKGKPPFPTN